MFYKILRTKNLVCFMGFQKDDSSKNSKLISLQFNLLYFKAIIWDTY